MTTIPLAGSPVQLLAYAISARGAPRAAAGASPAAPSAAAAPPQDTISLSERALQHLVGDLRLRPGVRPTVAVPGADATAEQKEAFQRELSGYEDAQRRVDATPFGPELQSYADTINDPGATDAQKLAAYTGYKVAAAVRHGQAHTFGVDAVDFKFDWLTRASDFMVRARDGDQSLSAFNEQETAELKRAGHQPVDLARHAAGHIDVLAGLGQLQQAVAGMDLVYDKVASALAFPWSPDGTPADPRSQDQGRTSGVLDPMAHALDPKTAIARAVSSALEALRLSRVASRDAGFVKGFTDTVTDFGRRVAERAG